MKKMEKYSGAPGSMHPDSDPEPGSIEAYYDHTWGEILLWTGTLGGPTIWAIQMQANYSLVKLVCLNGNGWVLTVISIVSFFLALACGLLSWWNWKRIGPTWPISADEGIRARTRLLALLGILLSVLFALVIAAQGISQFYFSPCEMS